MEDSSNSSTLVFSPVGRGCNVLTWYCYGEAQAPSPVEAPSPEPGVTNQQSTGTCLPVPSVTAPLDLPVSYSLLVQNSVSGGSVLGVFKELFVFLEPSVFFSFLRPGGSKMTFVPKGRYTFIF